MITTTGATNATTFIIVIVCMYVCEDRCHNGANAEVKSQHSGLSSYCGFQA